MASADRTVVDRAPYHPRGWAIRPLTRKELQLDIEVLVIVHCPASSRERRKLLHRLGTTLPGQRKQLSNPDDFSAQSAEMDAVSAYAKQHQLIVQTRIMEARSIAVRGTLAQLERAFGVRFVEVAGPLPYRSFEGDITVPKKLAGIIQTVAGFDTRPMARHHLHVRKTGGVDPSIVARAYHFPLGAAGAGQTIAIIEPGGGFHASDLQAYFKGQGLKHPKLSVVRVGGARNQPAPMSAIRAFLRDPSDATQASAGAVIATAEVTGDIQLVGAISNAAKIVVYFAPASKQGLYQAMARAIDDDVHKPDIITCSWGLDEREYQPSLRMAMDALFQKAAVKGITVCCSSGDSGSGPRGKLSVVFPASSPHVVACGGTHLENQGPHILAERVWNDPETHKASGGGFSKFPRPQWQLDACAPHASRGRGVPDVAAKADMENGYRVMLGGEIISAGGGTSAAAPLWAALVAQLNECLGTNVGYLTPLLYQTAFRNHTMNDIKEGNNGHYRARAEWDPCSGWGSPIGDKLLKALGGHAARAYGAG